MTEQETGPTPPEPTPQERERLQRHRAQIEEELPELRARAKQLEAAKREAAMREATVSGQLRRGVAQSGYDHRELAAKVGVSGKTMAEFLIGAAPLDSPAIDKLATLLKQELKPIG